MPIFVVGLVMSGPLHAQERSAGMPPAAADTASQQNLATGVRTDLTSLTTTVNATCSGGQTHGQTWTVSCGTGFTGNQTMVCVHGQTAVQSSNCQSALPCGTHPSGSKWAGTGAAGCPTNTVGTMMYECLDGNIVLDPTQTTCAAHGCNGTNYSQNCPTTVDGIMMTGMMTYSCTNDTLSMTGNTCHTYGKPCGSVPNGGTGSVACESVNPNLNGSLTTVCNDGATTISSFTCSPKTWHNFSVNLSGSCYKMENGSPSISCQVVSPNVPAQLAAAGVQVSAPLQNLQLSFSITGWTSNVFLNWNSLVAPNDWEPGSHAVGTCDNNAPNYVNYGGHATYDGTNLNMGNNVSIGSQACRGSYIVWHGGGEPGYTVGISAIKLTGQAFY